METTTAGHELMDLVRELYPICRSITGDGFRESLDILRKFIQLDVHEIPSGTRVLDWEIPREWNIRDAYIKNSEGEKIIDFKKLNLHVLNYSVPIDEKMSLSKLKSHLFSIPERPDWIPYRTSYYKENWGFCLTHNQLLELSPGAYEVRIDSSLEEGSLTYGELYLAGETPDEILISCHSCHPSLCNDNLSGMAVTTFLAKHVSANPRHYSYRFLFIPGTIGSIAWLAMNEQCISNIKHGLVVACVGDPGHSTYKRSRQHDAEIDRSVIHVLKHSGQDYEILDFAPYGYDERQYGSPGFNLPVGSLTRTPHGRYPEYHTSADNLVFIQPEALDDSFQKYLNVFEILEHNKTFVNTNPKGEPQLGRRGLYGAFGGRKDSSIHELAMLWVLNYSDGLHSLLAIAEIAGLPFDTLWSAAQVLKEHGLLTEIQEENH